MVVVYSPGLVDNADVMTSATERIAGTSGPRASLHGRLEDSSDPEVIRLCHRRSAWRHLLIAGAHAALVVVAMAIAASDARPQVWLPAALIVGIGFFGCTVLLHEIVHGNVFARPRPWVERLLGLAYGLPIALSPTQYTRWHLDHHRHVGSDAEDPKRAYLSPRPGSGRWRKLRFLTPWFFVIYFRAARAAAAAYAPADRRRIACERLGMQAVIVAALVAIGLACGPWAVVRAFLVPVLLVFPVVFTLNRIGQHYWIDPADEAKGGTRVEGNVFWRWAFLWSNYHLEHHYYPGVPFYRLRALNRALTPFFGHIGWPNRTYRRLAAEWFLRDRPAHALWDAP